jgi:hypothetical protein
LFELSTRYLTASQPHLQQHGPNFAGSRGVLASPRSWHTGLRAWKGVPNWLAPRTDNSKYGLDRARSICAAGHARKLHRDLKRLAEAELWPGKHDLDTDLGFTFSAGRVLQTERTPSWLISLLSDNPAAGIVRVPGVGTPPTRGVPLQRKSQPAQAASLYFLSHTGFHCPRR